MNPIFTNGEGQGIGHSFGDFTNHFIHICEEQKRAGRAKAFAFIIYDFQDNYTQNILRTAGGFAQLDRLSGEDLTVFYMASQAQRYVEEFNKIFLGAFDINERQELPFVLFFNVVDQEVTDVEIATLSANEMFLFKELYDCLEDYINRIKNIEKEQPKITPFIKVWQMTKKVALDKFINWFVDKAAQQIHNYI